MQELQMILERWIARHWMVLVFGCLLTGIAVRIAYAERGYLCIGGEWLIIPCLFVIERFFIPKRRGAVRR